VLPLIGFLGGTSADTFADRLRAFRQGLADTGYAEGENVGIEYRLADNQTDSDIYASRDNGRYG
jgi:putative ABC transport system substrate-binding protein